MRLQCYFCGKSVSTNAHKDLIVRAILICPECIEAEKVIIPDSDAKENK